VQDLDLLPGGTHNHFGKESDKAVRVITDFTRAQFRMPEEK